MHVSVEDLTFRSFGLAITFFFLFYCAQLLTHTKVERIEKQTQEPTLRVFNLWLVLFHLHCHLLPTLPSIFSEPTYHNI
jgi:hypothetical protein